MNQNPTRHPLIANPPAPRAAIFDFDLTLADSTRAASACIDYGLVELGFDPVGPDRARRTIGLGLEQTFQDLTGVSDSAITAKFRALFLEHADLVMVSQTHLLSGVPRALDTLRRAHIKLGIVSTKYRFRIHAILEKFELGNWFDVIVGGEDVQAHKPDPEGLIKALRTLEVGPDEAVYVGDHIVDAEAAKLASVPFVAVLSGETRRGEFNEFPNVGILGSAAQLPGFIASFGTWPPTGRSTPPPS